MDLQFQGTPIIPGETGGKAIPGRTANATIPGEWEQGNRGKQGHSHSKRNEEGCNSKRIAISNENSIYVFIFWELRGLSPNLHIHVSVNDLYSQDRSTYLAAAKQTDPPGNV